MAVVVLGKAQNVFTPIPLAQRNADLVSDQFDIVAPARGLMAFINVTNVPGSAPAFTVTIRAVDLVTSTVAGPAILTSASITGVGLTILRIHPELTAAANTIAKDMVPPRLEVFCDHTNANNVTYSVSIGLAL